MNRKINENVYGYFAILCIFIALKLFYRNADNSDLFFLLKPISIFIEFITGSNSVFTPGLGFYHRELNILIDKSCSGFNFWMICFTLFSFTVFHHRKEKTKILLLPVLFFTTYILAVFSNISRILIAIQIQTGLFSAFKDKYEWLHEAQGSFVFVFFFILFYLSLHFILSKDNNSYEKST